MGEFKGTKGKWEFILQPLPTYGYYIQTVDKSHKNSFIGEVGGGLQSENEIQANALLISKAPEMLELLISISQSENTPISYRKQAKKLIKEATEVTEL